MIKAVKSLAAFLVTLAILGNFTQNHIILMVAALTVGYLVGKSVPLIGFFTVLWSTTALTQNALWGFGAGVIAAIALSIAGRDNSEASSSSGSSGSSGSGYSPSYGGSCQYCGNKANHTWEFHGESIGYKKHCPGNPAYGTRWF